MRWPAIISCFYFVLLSTVMLPFYMLTSSGFEASEYDEMIQIILTDIYPEVYFWVIVTLVSLGQFLLLWIRVKELPRDRKPQARLWVTAGLIGLCMAALFVGTALSMIELFKIDGDLGINFETSIILLTIIPWTFWMAYFYRYHRNDHLTDYFDRGFSTLLKGSLFELFICLPAHIIVRQRADCCAGMLTGMGLACGLSVMLFCFGPVILLLIYRRIQIKSPSEKNHPPL